MTALVSNDSSNDKLNNLGARAKESAERVLRSTRTAFDGLADGVQQLQQDANSVAGQAVAMAESLAQQGARGLRAGSQNLADRAHSASRETRHYIERQPVRSVLIAAAGGAALMVLLTLLARSGRR